MQKNIYFRTAYRRDNPIKEFIYNAFYKLGCFMRIFIEVFIRKDFGQRYFNIVSAIFAVLTVGVFLIYKSIVSELSYGMFNRYGSNGGGEHTFLKDNWLLLAYLAAFIFVCIRHHRARKHEPSVYDFERFSLSAGTIHPFFANFQLNGKVADPRTVQIFYEPMPFFIGGIIIAFMGQSLGWFLIFASICYALSYYAAYHKGDQIILDKIDEMIMNGEMENMFVNDNTPENGRGVRFYARKPNSKELRQQVANALVVNEEIEDDVVLV